MDPLLDIVIVVFITMVVIIGALLRFLTHASTELQDGSDGRRASLNSQISELSLGDLRKSLHGGHVGYYDGALDRMSSIRKSSVFRSRLPDMEPVSMEELRHSMNGGKAPSCRERATYSYSIYDGVPHRRSSLSKIDNCSMGDVRASLSGNLVRYDCETIDKMKARQSRSVLGSRREDIAPIGISELRNSLGCTKNNCPDFARKTSYTLFEKESHRKSSLSEINNLSSDHIRASYTGNLVGYCPKTSEKMIKKKCTIAIDGIQNPVCMTELRNSFYGNQTSKLQRERSKSYFTEQNKKSFVINVNETDSGCDVPKKCYDQDCEILKRKTEVSQISKENTSPKSASRVTVNEEINQNHEEKSDKKEKKPKKVVKAKVKSKMLPRDRNPFHGKEEDKKDYIAKNVVPVRSTQDKGHQEPQIGKNTIRSAVEKGNIESKKVVRQMDIKIKTRSPVELPKKK